MRLHTDFGPPIELAEDITQKIYKMADADGVDPAIWIRAHIAMTDILMAKGLHPSQKRKRR